MRSKPSSAGSSASGASGSVKCDELHARLGEAALVRVLAGCHELVAPGRGLEGVGVSELPLGVVRMSGLAHRSTRHLAVAEDGPRDALAELGVLGVRSGVRLLLVQDDHTMHLFLSVAGQSRLSRVGGTIVSSRDGDRLVRERRASAVALVL